MARHPEQVRILVAHEPPAAQELPDREQALASCEGIKETYLREGFGPAMARFIALVSYQGPVTPRSRDQVARFFDGLDLLPPGLVHISQWGLSGQIDPATGGLVGYCAIARKP